MVDTVYLNINPNKHYLTRDELMLIDLLANFDWKRPIYFTQFSSPRSARSEGLSATRRLRIPFRADPDAQRAG